MTLCPRIERECALCSETAFGLVCGGNLLMNYRNDHTGTLIISGLPDNVKCVKQLTARERRAKRRGKLQDLDYQEAEI